MKQPERISQEDLVKALNKADEPQEVFDGDPDELIDMAVAEMGRRLKNEPDEMGETALVNLVKEANKAAERRAAQKAAADRERHEQDVLDIVRNSPLPPERKRELIRNEIRRLDALRAELEAELDE